MLVVDDSAVVRQFMLALLSQEPDVTVTTAADPLIALGKMARARPDVILLDLEMPRMGGLEFLRKVMREDPIPVVVCSSHAGRGTRGALEALDEGAVEVLAKPRVGVREFLHESAVMLLDTLRAAARARLSPPGQKAFRPGPRLTADAVLPPPRAGSRALSGGVAAETLVAIGASTGGPEALSTLLAALPAESPALAIVQHMPRPFTGPFARRLDQLCALEVREAEEGDLLTRGRALVAPGDRHLVVERSGEGYRVRLLDGPLVCRHRPSIDVLFRSVAQAAGAAAVGVALTGMGGDGAAGLLEMRQAGAATLAQDEATSVVFGIPKEAIERGAAQEVVPLPRMAEALLRRAAETGRRKR